MASFYKQYDCKPPSHIDNLLESYLELQKNTDLIEPVPHDLFDDVESRSENIDPFASSFFIDDMINGYTHIGDMVPSSKQNSATSLDCMEVPSRDCFLSMNKQQIELIKHSRSQHNPTLSSTRKEIDCNEHLPYYQTVLDSSHNFAYNNNCPFFPSPWVVFDPETVHEMPCETYPIKSQNKNIVYPYTKLKLPYNGAFVRRNIPGIGIKEDDVLFGRGKKANNHPGNKYFRELVSRMSSHYKDCTRPQKTALASSIVDAIHKKGGRFLTPVPRDSGSWIEVEGVALRKKTSQAFRDSIIHQA